MNTYLEDHVAIERVIDGSDRIAVIGRGHGTIEAIGRHFDVPIMHLLKLQMDWRYDSRLFSMFRPYTLHSNLRLCLAARPGLFTIKVRHFTASSEELNEV
jgi:hypothetical protein